jgi:hypothetical protein
VIRVIRVCFFVDPRDPRWLFVDPRDPRDPRLLFRRSA